MELQHFLGRHRCIKCMLLGISPPFSIRLFLPRQSVPGGFFQACVLVDAAPEAHLLVDACGGPLSIRWPPWGSYRWSRLRECPCGLVSISNTTCACNHLSHQSVAPWKPSATPTYFRLNQSTHADITRERSVSGAYNDIWFWVDELQFQNSSWSKLSHR